MNAPESRPERPLHRHRVALASAATAGRRLGRSMAPGDDRNAEATL